jgi:hypothetical protein
MARGGMDTSWLWLVGIGVAIYFGQKAGVIPVPATPTPYSIYPEFAYTAQTSMAATRKQKAPAAVIPPTTAFTSVQQQEQAALMSQCAGSWPSCTNLLSDWQLGL